MHNKSFIVCLLLCATILLVFYQVQTHDFINFDDPLYISENNHVRAGLTSAGIVWAFGFTDSPYWHPLTWLSHMLDCQLYGLNPGMHHLTNVLLHLANSLLLFFVFYQMTGALWRSCFVAALFALHPLNVESVAWLSERKNLLSTFFWMLTMVFYVRYTKKPGLARYVLVVAVFALGLMAKPMLVTLPFVLLLLDYWPLGRLPAQQMESDVRTETAQATIPVFQRTTLVSLVLEKTPLLILSVLSSSLTSLSVQRSGILIPTTLIPMRLRVANAIVSYARYIGKLIWPQDLAFFYPYPTSVPLWQTVGAGLLLAGISFFVIRAWRKLPYLCIGWLWYLGTLIPVIGLVQAGQWPAIADRFTYVPAIGLFVMLAWFSPHLLTKWRHRRATITAAACIVLAVMMIISWSQVRLWKNSLTLYQHALHVTSDNHLAHNNLGNALVQKGKFEEAIEHYAKALEICATFREAKKNYAAAHFNLALALVRQQRLEEAITHFSEALRTQPDDADTHYNLGVTLEKQGRLDAAMIEFSEVLRIQPDNGEAHTNLGLILARQGRFKEAIPHYSQALQHNPDDGETHNNLGVALFTVRQLDQAISHYRTAIKLDPSFSKAYNNLGNALARQGQLDEAISQYSRALELKTNYPEAHNNLGVALAQQGKMGEAIVHFDQALRLKPDYAQARVNLKYALDLVKERRDESSLSSTP